MRRTALSDPVWSGPSRSPLGVGDVYRSGELTAIASTMGGTAHISVSAPGRYPTWDEISSIKDIVFPDRSMAMLLPPRSEHVNIHETCLHIWEVGA